MKIFMDSSIIIETLKGNKKAIEVVATLLGKVCDVELFINPIVFSETVFQLYYKKRFSLDEIKGFITKAKILAEDEVITRKSLDLIVEYNLKPNDALILATCKHYGIPYLISLDSDFRRACEKEGIILIDSFEKLMKAFGNE